MNTTTNAAGPRYLSIQRPGDDSYILPYLLERLRQAGEEGLTVRGIEPEVAEFLARRRVAVTTPMLTAYLQWLFANGKAKRTARALPFRYYAITTEGDKDLPEVPRCR